MNFLCYAIRLCKVQTLPVYSSAGYGGHSLDMNCIHWKAALKQCPMCADFPVRDDNEMDNLVWISLKTLQSELHNICFCGIMY